MRRRRYLAAFAGSLMASAGCLMPDGSDRSWGLNIKNKSGGGIELEVRLSHGDLELLSRAINLNPGGEWVLEEEYGERAPVEVVIDVEDGVKRDRTWEDPDGANPLVVDINSKQEVEFVQGVS